MRIETYQARDIAIFRDIEPRFTLVSTEHMITLFTIYSDEVAAAGWLDVDKKGAKQFCEWAYESPVEAITGND